MALKEKEIQVIKDLQTQEQTCIDKYELYGSQANDSVLKILFSTLKKNEQKHYDSLSQVLSGNVPECDCNDDEGRNYAPTPTYKLGDDSPEKKLDAFLATDCISSEKLVSGEYNTNVFAFADTAIRKLLADIQIEEQNHAEMLYKYKTVNSMA
jgi:rubrerythrin